MKIFFKIKIFLELIKIWSMYWFREMHWIFFMKRIEEWPLNFYVDYNVEKLQLFFWKFVLKFKYFSNESKYSEWIDVERRIEFFSIKCSAKISSRSDYKTFVNFSVKKLQLFSWKFFLKSKYFSNDSKNRECIDVERYIESFSIKCSVKISSRSYYKIFMSI